MLGLIDYKCLFDIEDSDDFFFIIFGLFLLPLSLSYDLNA